MSHTTLPHLPAAHLHALHLVQQAAAGRSRWAGINDAEQLQHVASGKAAVSSNLRAGSRLCCSAALAACGCKPPATTVCKPAGKARVLRLACRSSQLAPANNRAAPSSVSSVACRAGKPECK